MEYFILHGQEQTGPFSFEELSQKLQAGDCTESTLVWHKGLQDWKQLRDISPSIVLAPQAAETELLQPVANSEDGRISPASQPTSRAWYDYSLVLFPAMLCCIPIAFIPLWLTKRYDTRVKVGLSAVLGLQFILQFLFIGWLDSMPAPETSSFSVSSPQSKTQTGSKPVAGKYINQHEKFRLGDFSYVIGDCVGQDSIGPRGLRTYSTSTESRFLVLSYTIINETNETQTVLSDDFVLIDRKGRKYRPAANALTALLMEEESKDFILSELQPGLPRQSVTAFEVPHEAALNDLVLVVPEKGLFGTKKKEVLIRTR